MRVRIPASQDIHGDAPGPILQVSRGGGWVGSSKLSISGDRVTRIDTKRVEAGPLFIAYELTYVTQGGSRYVASVQCNGGMEFVRFVGKHGRDAPGSAWRVYFDVDRIWSDASPGAESSLSDVGKDPRSMKTIHGRQLVNHGSCILKSCLKGSYLSALGNYQTWTAFKTGTFANFWDQDTDDALGVFVDKGGEWQDHLYTNHVESPVLQVRYYYQDGVLSWRWPILRGSPVDLRRLLRSCQRQRGDAPFGERGARVSRRMGSLTSRD